MHIMRVFLLCLLSFTFHSSYSVNSECCANMGGLHYCDTSAGRFVCKNGYYSSCYCTRHAVMDLQKFQGCCMWQGGVLDADNGLVVCNNGGVSEICTLQLPNAEGLTAFR
ncbi:neurogenic locus notch like protein precursor (plasmid) [Legionella adelaidensis]|uniref:Neurogenic locus notch like protein n=2 Tax=Legionella adelaidensis TaxID=45056 RepID=A0A0W0R4J6_9GAMM|nr:hypothetical protein [Legionella adelaidensis]KTC66001.1 neurogenic locus notch like protein precursor [Legionella adelaidensis]VEH86325.1 neurogenic locus notch like protein precursor [Legionella adelaidensis]